MSVLFVFHELTYVVGFCFHVKTLIIISLVVVLKLQSLIEIGGLWIILKYPFCGTLGAIAP